MLHVFLTMFVLCVSVFSSIFSFICIFCPCVFVFCLFCPSVFMVCVFSMSRCVYACVSLPLFMGMNFQKTTRVSACVSCLFFFCLCAFMRVLYVFFLSVFIGFLCLGVYAYVSLPMFYVSCVFMRVYFVSFFFYACLCVCVFVHAFLSLYIYVYVNRFG